MSNAFCMALLQGKSDDAKQLFDTGNVNLRTSFAGINGEAMFPVHCAVMGGNLAILQWLVDTHCCPVAVRREARTGRMLSVQTSADRSLVDLAMTGKPKLDVLRYLVMEKNMSVMDTKDPNLAPKALEALLRVGVAPASATEPIQQQQHHQHQPVSAVHFIEDETEGSQTTIEDACILCCEKPMDCVIIPCGHQVCCEECGKLVRKCPVCKVDCSVLRIFRQ
uniref:RING-type domain-containing protein n=1 Tax=Cyclophora tenuis TaxID=216820 RepID=A0A6U1PLW1_CYCTE